MPENSDFRELDWRKWQKSCWIRRPSLLAWHRKAQRRSGWTFQAALLPKDAANSVKDSNHQTDKGGVAPLLNFWDWADYRKRGNVE